MPLPAMTLNEFCGVRHDVSCATLKTQLLSAGVDLVLYRNVWVSPSMGSEKLSRGRGRGWMHRILNRGRARGQEIQAEACWGKDCTRLSAW